MNKIVTLRIICSTQRFICKWKNKQLHIFIKIKMLHFFQILKYYLNILGFQIITQKDLDEKIQMWRFFFQCDLHPWFFNSSPNHIISTNQILVWIWNSDCHLPYGLEIPQFVYSCSSKLLFAENHTNSKERKYARRMGSIHSLYVLIFQIIQSIAQAISQTMQI